MDSTPNTPEGRAISSRMCHGEVRWLARNLISACDRLLLTCEGTAEDRDAVYQAKDALRLALFGPMRVGRDVEVKNA